MKQQKIIDITIAKNNSLMGEKIENMSHHTTINSSLAIALVLDIGTEKTGYSIWKQIIDHKWEIIDSGYIWVKKTANENKTAKDRYPKMIFEINQLLNTYKPHQIIVEGTYYSKCFNSIEYPLKIHGFIESYCLLHNILFQSVKPSYWRSLLDFPKEKRKYLKKYSLTYVTDYFPNLKVIIDDEADAICIGEAVLNHTT